MTQKRLYPLIVLSLLSVAMSTFAAATSGQEPASGSRISRQQLSAQISFFNDALSELGAASADEAARLWAEGHRTRNGVYQYAVSCHTLKQKLIDSWGSPETNFWIIGTSSPWVTRYDILSKTEISKTEAAYVVRYQWATSAGQEAPTTERLLLHQANGYWCVGSASQDV